MSAGNDLDREIDIDLAGIFASIWRNKLKILGVSLLLTLLAWLILQTIEPRYRSEASILIRQADPVLGEQGTSQSRSTSTLDNRDMASKVQLLRSRSIGHSIAVDLQLEELPEFETRLGRSFLDRILATLGLVDDDSGVTPRDRVLDSYFERLKVYQAESSRVIVVEFWSHDKELAAKVPNLVANKFIKMQQQLKRGAKPDELRQLEAEVEKLGQSVAADEAAIALFRKDKDLLAGNNNTTLATQELSELSTELGQVKTDLSRARANALAVKRAVESGSLNQSRAVLQSPLIQRLRERQVTLRAQRSDLSADLLPKHPRMIRLQSQIQSLEDQIENEAEKVQASLQQEVRVHERRLSDLQSRRSGLKTEAGRVGTELAELQGLERELNAQRQILSQYLVRLKEAKSRQERSFVPADAFIFSTAQVQSRAYFPKRLPILSAVFFGSILLASMLNLAWAALFGTANPVKESFVQPVAQSTAVEIKPDETDTVEATHVAPEPTIADGVALEDQVEPKQEQVPEQKPVPEQEPELVENVAGKSLAVATSLSMLGRSRVAVISPEPDAKSAGTVALVRHLVALGKTAVVVDMTGQGASTDMMLESDQYLGLKDILSSHCSFREAIHGDNYSDAHIMPSGKAEAEQAALGSGRLPMILDGLHQAYDFVVVDCGDTDADGVTRIANNATVYVISAEDANADSVRLASEKMLQAGFRPPLIVSGDAATHSLGSHAA